MKSLTEKDIKEIEEFVRNNSVENIAKTLLFKLGFKSKLIGTVYLTDAIAKKYNAHSGVLYKSLYGEIADKHNATVCRVERAIRHSINECFDGGNMMSLNQLFKCEFVTKHYSPTNSEFISAVCTWIHIEKDCSLLCMG